MIISYKLSINILLEPVKVVMKRTQTKNETVWKYSNNKIQSTCFYLPYGCWVNGFFPIFLQLLHIGRAVLNISFSKAYFAKCSAVGAEIFPPSGIIFPKVRDFDLVCTLSYLWMVRIIRKLYNHVWSNTAVTEKMGKELSRYLKRNIQARE